MSVLDVILKRGTGPEQLLTEAEIQAQYAERVSLLEGICLAQVQSTCPALPQTEYVAMATQAFCSERFLDLGMSKDVVVLAPYDAVLAAFLVVMKSFESTQCQKIENEAVALAAHAALLASLRVMVESTANAAKQISPWVWALGGLVVVGLITPWPGDEVVALAGLGLVVL